MSRAAVGVESLRPQRHSSWRRTANQLNFAAYAFGNDTALHTYRKGIEARIAVDPGASPVFGSGAFTVIDPDGNRIVFGADNAPASVDAPALSARLQHFAIRSDEPELLVAFYRDTLGFVVSDRVEDDHGGLSAGFLRTDAEHHALAIFVRWRCATITCLSVTDWREAGDWADRVSALGVPMVWGVGRHVGQRYVLWCAIPTETWPRFRGSSRFAHRGGRRASGRMSNARSICGAWRSCAVEREGRQSCRARKDSSAHSHCSPQSDRRGHPRRQRRRWACRAPALTDISCCCTRRATSKWIPAAAIRWGQGSSSWIARSG